MTDTAEEAKRKKARRRATQAAFAALSVLTLRKLDRLFARYSGGRLPLADLHSKLHDVLVDGHARAAFMGRTKAGDVSPFDEDDQQFGVHSADIEETWLEPFMEDVRAGHYGLAAADPKAPDASTLDLDKLSRRAAYYVRKLRGSTNEAWASTLAGDTMLWWRLVSTEDHCFPAGTMIETQNGQRPIEELRIGEFVQTLHGLRPVTQLFKSIFEGDLRTIESEGRSVQCTPNHPFLTDAGWIAAEHLKSGQRVVLHQNLNDFIFGKVALPNSRDGVPTRNQISILRLIARFLLNLPVCQRFKSCMPVPVVSVGLNDESVNADVYNEVCLDNKRSIKTNIQFRQYLSQPDFKFRRFETVQFSMPGSESIVNSNNSFGVGRSPVLNLLNDFLPLHRILPPHVVSGCISNNLRSNFRFKGKPQPSCPIVDRGNGKVEFICNILRAVARIVTSHKAVSIGCPSPWLCGCNSTACLTQVTMPVSDIPAFRTSLPNLHNLFAGIRSVATFYRTVLRSWGRRVHNALERIAALLADELFLCSDTHRLSIPQNKKKIYVYNIEVDGEHHYIANGFVVHNCDDCPHYQATSPHRADSRPTDPAAGNTECGTNCTCFWETADGQTGFKAVTL